MHTRALTGVAAVLLASGCGTAVAGLHPAVESPMIVRCGFLLILCSLPAWITGEARRAARVSAEALADAHTAGYHLAITDLRAGAPQTLPRPDTTGPAGGSPGRPGSSSLRAVGGCPPVPRWWDRVRALWISGQQRASKRS